MHVERLQHLIETMRNVQAREMAQPEHPHFDMENWFGDYNPENNYCKTVACAWGWEATTDYAKKQGVVVERSVIWFDGYGRIDAARAYFQIKEQIANILFFPNYYVAWPGDYQYIKPQNIINRVDELLFVGEERILRRIMLATDEISMHAARALPGGMYYDKTWRHTYVGTGNQTTEASPSA